MLGKYSNTLDMMSLRKHIDGLDFFDGESSLDEKFYISYHSDRITRNI